MDAVANGGIEPDIVGCTCMFNMSPASSSCGVRDGTDCQSSRPAMVSTAGGTKGSGAILPNSNHEKWSLLAGGRAGGRGGRGAPGRAAGPAAAARGQGGAG